MTAAALPPSSAANTILAPEVLRAPVRSRMFFVPSRYWAFIIVVATLVAALAWDVAARDSLWVGVGIWAVVAIGLHTAFAARVIPWIPGVIALVALLQWVLAAWAGYHVPPPLYTMAMAVPANQYFSYAVPATLLFIVGLYLPLWRVGRRVPARVIATLPPDFVRTCDIMIVVGITASVAQTFAVPYVLRYAVALVEYLAFVGALGLALAKADGWGWRVAGVLALRAFLSTNDGVFQELLLWATYSFVVLAYVLRWRVRTLVALVVGSVIVMGALNEIKLDYRSQIIENPDLTTEDRVETLGRAFGHQLEQPFEAFDGRSLSRSVARVNQGWIISRIMYWTPTREPYAHGETLLAALHAVLVPRIIDPDKYVAGGSYFTRFTGVALRGTSMNLSAAGEMYANFGPSGGLVGVFLFALGLGLLYGVFVRWASDSPLWWAWAPYVMLYTMQAETGIGEALNHVARSFLVMTAVVWVVPAWQSLRRWQTVLRRIREVARSRLPSISLSRPHHP